MSLTSKHRGPDHIWRHCSISPSKYYRKVSQAEVEQKTREFLAKGGKIERQVPITCHIPDFTVKNIDEADEYIDDAGSGP